MEGCKELRADTKIPVTMLSGFLGRVRCKLAAGKTTLLRHLLQDPSHGLRIGCIVNDVAAVNIDAKLVRASRSGSGGSVPAANMADTIELANGCACCSLQEELFMSFEALLAVSYERGIPYDRLILENSGVAEPHNIRDLFQDSAGLPIMRRIQLDTMVTVVDSATFLPAYSTVTPTALRPDLGPSGSLRPVVDLLVEQLECADYVLLNKTELLAPGQLPPLQAVVSSINPLATVVACRDGAVAAAQVFARPAKALAANLNIEAQHRAAVAVARANGAQPAKKPKTDASDAGAHAHDHGKKHAPESGQSGRHKDDGEHNQSDKNGHGHKHVDKHVHDHKHDHDQEHTHSDGHNHGHSGHDKKHDHDHKHGHGHGHDHGHGHGHDHTARQETTAEQRFGIRSFVYARRRPFHPQRLQDLVLQWLPVKTIKAHHGEVINPASGDSAIKMVLRSKGFMWLSHSHETAFYWSHAGQHFEIRDEGDWWDAVERGLWPPAEKQRATILSDFDGRHGDRRQEIVFIGARMEAQRIESQLGAALLSDNEMAAYTAKWAA